MREQILNRSFVELNFIIDDKRLYPFSAPRFFFLRDHLKNALFCSDNPRKQDAYMANAEMVLVMTIAGHELSLVKPSPEWEQRVMSFALTNETRLDDATRHIHERLEAIQAGAMESNDSGKDRPVHA